MTRIAPYGSWSSPITPDVLVEQVVRLSDPAVDGDDVLWLEGRPAEGGRQVVVRRSPDGKTTDLVPSPYSARTRVHEYGGRSYAVRDGTCFFVNDSDQRLYRVTQAGVPEPITDEPDVAASVRFAAPVPTADGSWLVCVREQHLDGGVENDLVAVSSSGGAVNLLSAGHDFVGAPAISPDGSRVAWCTWDHPQMPWDATQLWEAHVAHGVLSSPPRLVAGGGSESITQPRYAANGALYFVSDRTGWWNLYRDAGPAGAEALAPMEAEFATPDWVLGLSSYALLSDGTLVATWWSAGRAELGTIRASGVLEPIATPFASFSGVVAAGSGVVAIAASPTLAPCVVRVDVDSRALDVVRVSRLSVVDDGYLSVPWSLEVPTGGGEVAHARVYEPCNADFAADPGELPPLIVAVHGGPTSSSSASLDYAVQFWTSRGFCVADVDYGGSTGYGRAYRGRLAGAWGVVDVEDCENAARELVARGLVDPRRLLVHGGSAGGFTALCALTFGSLFAGGAVYFGVSDLAALARDTHKFESRYLDGLVGPWPEVSALYEQRSPVFHTDKIVTPIIVFQGSDDKVVPPDQAEMMVASLRERGVPVAYVVYAGEGHGFRKAASIKRTAEAELSFYGQLLGFTPAGEIEPVVVENEAALERRGR